VNENLAKTFEKIRDNKYAFHTELADVITEEINSFNGNFSNEDIRSYKTEQTNLINFEFDDFIGHISPPPSSGVVVAFIVNVMANLKARGELPADDAEGFQHKLLEAFKFAFGKRSLLGDPAYQPNPTEFAELVSNLTSYEYAGYFASKIKDTVLDLQDYEPAFEIKEDAGTTHLNVVDENGMVVTVTSTINTEMGSKCIGRNTGIIYNNEMDDFSVPGHTNHFGVPPSPSNFIEPGKRPMSSMAPTIITNKNGEFVLAVGGSGGTRITTGTATVIVKTLLLGMEVNEAVQEARLHHQLLPESIRYEIRFNNDTLALLEKRGHKRGDETNQNAATQAILKKDGYIYAVSDSRKSGIPDGY